MTKIAVLLMVKNEQRRIHVTLESIKNEVDGIVLYDTGSTDDTIKCVKIFAENNNIELHLLEGEFEDFATSRNKMLDFADTFHYDYYLLLDSNDELRLSCTNSTLKQIIQEYNEDIFLIKQQWYIGNNISDLIYFNTRLIKANPKFRYKGAVHEYIHNGTDDTVEFRKLSNIILFQDRVADNDGKTRDRWERDLEMLKKEIQKDPTEPRTQFYLAQTYQCLSNPKKARHYYKKRVKNLNGFYEERYSSMVRLALLTEDEDTKILWNLKAFELIKRAEPLIEISRIYRFKNQFHLAYMFARMACMLDYPQSNLMVDEKCYSHDRWHELGIVSYYVANEIATYNLEESNNVFMTGKAACEKAIESADDSIKQIDINNLKYYT
jgi:hypothetical protein